MKLIPSLVGTLILLRKNIVVSKRMPKKEGKRRGSKTLNLIKRNLYLRKRSEYKLEVISYGKMKKSINSLTFY